MYPAYISKQESKCKEQVNHLMVPGREGWHYIAVINFYAVLREITSKHHGNLYCLNCIHFLRIENKRGFNEKVCEKVCENKDLYNIAILSEDTKILEFNQSQKSDKSSFIIYADLEIMIEKTDVCKSNPENTSATKKVNIFHQAFQYLNACHLKT